MRKHAQLRWEWNKENSETHLIGYCLPLAYISKTGNENTLFMTCFASSVAPPLGMSSEAIKTNASQFKIEQRATARVRFHLNERIKLARREFAAVKRECSDLLKRLP